MTLDELKKIIAQIKKYKLESKIKDINEWFASLNKTQVNNFISLDIKLSKFLQKNRQLLVNLNFLSSKYYLEDLKMINDSNISSKKASILYDVATNPFSFESEYHREDMKRLYSQKSETKMSKMAALAGNKYSIGSDYHEFSMKLIESVKDDEIVNLLVALASNKTFLCCADYTDAISLVACAKNYYYAQNLYVVADSAKDDMTYLYQDMEKIAKAKNEEISDCLLDVANDKTSLGSEHHLSDMETIFNAKNEKVATCLAKVACSGSSLRSLHHAPDMQCIADIENIDILGIIGALAVDYTSLQSVYHALHMKLVSNAKTERRANSLYSVAVDSDSIGDQQHERNLKLISTADSDEKAELLSKVAASLCFIKRSLHPDTEMSLIYDAKTIAKASHLASIATNDTSLRTSYHYKDMQLIYTAKDEEVEQMLFNEARSVDSLSEPKHEFVMLGIANSGVKKPINMALNMAESYCDGDESKEIDPRVFSIGSKYKKNN